MPGHRLYPRQMLIMAAALVAAGACGALPTRSTAGASVAVTATGPHLEWAANDAMVKGSPFCATVESRVSLRYKSPRLTVIYKPTGFKRDLVDLDVQWGDPRAKKAVYSYHSDRSIDPALLWSGPPLIATHNYVTAPSWPWVLGFLRVTGYGPSQSQACLGDNAIIKFAASASPTPPSKGSLPDLVVRRVSAPPASIARGKHFRVTTTTANIGAGAAGRSTLSFTLVASDYKLRVIGRHAVPTLAPGKAATMTTTLTVPATTLRQRYTLVVCADSGNAVTESNEKNNCRAAHTLMTVS